MRRAAFLLALGALAALAGCQTCTIVQVNVFSDEDGNIVKVAYGRSERDHVNTFIAANGREMEFKSKLAVDVTLPDGDTFRAWQCMNYQRTGTMYKTDNGEWQLLANGFTCLVYHRREDDEKYYDTVYRGVLCETPGDRPAKNGKWREMKKDADGRWK